MKNKIIILAFLVCCVYTTAFAEVTINAQVDKLSITADETIAYKLVVTSTRKDSILEPVMPDFAGFTVISQAQSSTVSFIEGEVKSVAVYAYILAPKDSGKLKIKPASVKVQDKTISTPEFEIEVKPARPSQNMPEEKSGPAPEIPPASTESQITL
ncbi:MAG: BatD family protein [Candidatus Omnitrophica bacterium]|nr:BatD family protein [Candidatus Omnitrophota bacterium]